MPKVIAVVEQWIPDASHRDRFEPGHWAEVEKLTFPSEFDAGNDAVDMIAERLEKPGFSVKFYTEAEA